MIPGYATREGTSRYKARFASFHPDHFRDALGLFFSSIGIGSYLGNPDDATDLMYQESLKLSLMSGVNVVDTAANYRAQRSERSFGKALKELIESGTIQRDEIILCTKGGYIPFDGSYPSDPLAYIKETYLDKGLLKKSDLSQGCHAMTPAYLENQLSSSLRNLGVETIDIYYIHNPETQLSDVEPLAFRARMLEAFKWAEEKVKEGKIRFYGTATWNGFRVEADQADYLSLQDLHILAREAGGQGHHFRVIQLPFNLAMPEAWVVRNQGVGPGSVPVLEAARRFDVIVIASASLMQSHLAGPFPDFLAPHFEAFPTSAQKSIQFGRSVPGITTALVGMKTTKHVNENVFPAGKPVFTEEELFRMFQKA